MVDRLVEGEPAGQVFIDPGIEWAQPIEAGLTGVLTRIDVRIRGGSAVTGPLFYDVLPLEAGGIPVEDPAQALATGVVPLDTLSTEFAFVPIEGLAIQVEPGDRFALALRMADTAVGSVAWVLADDDTSLHFCRGTCSATWTGIGLPFQYRTWVDPELELNAFADALDTSFGQSFIDEFVPESAQSFTAIRRGNLVRFEVKVRGAGPEALQWYLLPAEPDGSPVEDLGQALASGSLPPVEIPPDTEPWDWVRVDGLDLPVEENERLAIALAVSPDSPSVYSWLLADPLYDGGTRWCRRPESTPPCAEIWNNIGNDFHFRTFLAAPEPGPGMLSAAALAVLSGLARPRRLRAGPPRAGC